MRTANNLAVLFLISVCSLGFGATSTTSAEAATGTINLVLANDHGFVVLADSRRTFSNGHFKDDSQKLFRIGKRSAMAIAGFASATAPGTPLDTQVAAILREHFRPGTNIGFEQQGLDGWMGVALAHKLNVVGAVFATLSSDQMEMEALAAGYDKDGKPRIIRFIFTPDYQVMGPMLSRLPIFTMTKSEINVRGFTFVSAGFDDIAKKIIAGDYQSSDPRIVRYYDALAAERLNNLNLRELGDLADVILEETKKSTPYVGGKAQKAIIAAIEETEWSGPQLSHSTERVIPTLLWLGGPSNMHRQDGQRFQMTTGGYEDLTASINDPYMQVFVGGGVEDVDVELDGNIFAGFVFENVTFKYKGGRFWFSPNNRLNNCKVEVQVGSVLAPESVLARTCKIAAKGSVSVDSSTIGAPLRPALVGCNIRTKSGTIRTITTGKYKGKDCRGSHIVWPMGIPIPLQRSLRNSSKPQARPHT